MSAYIEPIKTAIWVFPFLALFISSIFFVYQYRKYGTFIFTRALVLYSFVFYLLCTYFLVILPLPPVAEVAQYTTPKMELQLGASLKHFLDQTVLNIHDSSTYLPAIRQTVFLEPLFNVLLVVPFGIYLRYYFRFSISKTILLSFCLSLFFELTQLSGLYFIYPRPYRLFDVNDLFCNTLGGIVGYYLTPIFTFLLPSREDMDEVSYQKGQRVTILRRLAAWAIDWGIVSVASFIAMVIIRLVTKNNQLNFTDNYAFFVLQVIVYFIFLSYVMKGETIGKKIVRIRIMEEGRENVSFWALFKRYGLLYLIYVNISRLNFLFLPGLESDNHLITAVSVILTLLFFVLQVGFYLNMLWSIIRKNPRFFYERYSKTYLISTVKPKES